MLETLTESKKQEFAARFWMHVEKTESCWIWKGAKNTKGYGITGVPGGKTTKAHRIAFEFIKGNYAKELCVLHNCPSGDNPACVNPAHLFLGTRAVNNDDMRNKGRAVKGGNKSGLANCKYERGAGHHNAKLNDQKVKEIRAMAESGNGYVEIAVKFGVAPNTVHKIINRKSWKHL